MTEYLYKLRYAEELYKMTRACPFGISGVLTIYETILSAEAQRRRGE